MSDKCDGLWLAKCPPLGLQSQSINQQKKLEKHSLEVASTTFRRFGRWYTYLYAVSNCMRSAFPLSYRIACSSEVPDYTFSHAAENEMFSSCYLELWLMTLTRELDIDMLIVPNILVKGCFVRQLSREHTHRHTDPLYLDHKSTRSKEKKRLKTDTQ